MRRKILHADLDAFFCAVEILDNPGLKDSPFVVGGNPSGRGVVASASYPARAFGVRSAMPTAQALRLCPELIILPGRHSLYSEYSRKVMAVFFDAARWLSRFQLMRLFLMFPMIRFQAEIWQYFFSSAFTQNWAFLHPGELQRINS